jgi:hypothetical protein
MVARGDQQQGGGVRADAVEGEQAGRADGDQRDDELVQAADLVVEELHAAPQLPQRDADRLHRPVTALRRARSPPGRWRDGAFRCFYITRRPPACRLCVVG